MGRHFKHVRFDRDLFDPAEAFACGPILESVIEAMGMFRPKADTFALDGARAILKTWPHSAPLIARLTAEARDKESRAGALRQREFEEAVAFIDTTIIEHFPESAEFAADFSACPGGYFLFALKENWRDTGGPLGHRLSNGRVLGETELVAAAILLDCELCVDAFLADDTSSVASLMADIHACSKRFFGDQLRDVQRIEASERGRKAHENSPKQIAMTAVRAEYDRWRGRKAQYRSDAEFARKMFEKYGEVIESEGSIKNACTRWRRERKSSS